MPGMPDREPDLARPGRAGNRIGPGGCHIFAGRLIAYKIDFDRKYRPGDYVNDFLTVAVRCT